MIVLGLDPGFASVGWALVRMGGAKDVPVGMGVFRTAKSSQKRNVLASDDNVRRAREIAVFLRGLMVDGPHGPVGAVCAETMSFPRSSSVAAKMAMCWGVVSTLSAVLDVPILQATPMELKLRVAGSKTAAKEDVQKALQDLFGAGVLGALCKGIVASKEEHPYDALGAVVACRDSEVLRLARRMSADRGVKEAL